MKTSLTSILVNFLLQVMACNFNLRPSIKRYLKTDQGWINFSVGIRTIDNSVQACITFKEGKVKVSREIIEGTDTVMVFKNESIIWEMLKLPPNEVLNLLLKNKLYTQGNLSYLSLFNFYISLLMGKSHKKLPIDKEEFNKIEIKEQKSKVNRLPSKEFIAKEIDSGIKYLKDPYLSDYILEDFPRIKQFLNIHFEIKPEICHERPKLLTDWFKANGFEMKNDGTQWIPELRQANAFKYLMENKKPVIRKNDLIAGTTTTKEIGVVIYPDSHGTMIWGEIDTVDQRKLNSYIISEETKRTLHHEIFPFWSNRNFREWVRNKYNNPLCQQIDERFAVYFLWKTAALSHTIPDFPKLLKLGTKGIIKEIEETKNNLIDPEKRAFHEAMILCLEGINQYAQNLSKKAIEDELIENNPVRKLELKRLAEICKKVPENPAQSLDEAINAIWILWVGLHMENTNAGLSIGRLDQWLQPYFESDMKKIKTDLEQKIYIKKAIELVSCFYMRCTDHLPLIPDIGNYLFGGSSSDQAITLGGITQEGEDAVNDMTFIFLKVTEMLSIRDPNVNARYHEEKNSDTYLKRLCEVNLLTAATPSMHNDKAVMASLEEFNYDIKALRDWSATGCVEPTLSGKHIGHTNCMMMNMVAALEMALNNGKHPLMDWNVGPRTGKIEDEAFNTFDEFFNAFSLQYKFIIDQAIAYNNMLGEAHSYIRPTPFLSTMIEGCISNGVDATKGGSLYNSSGAACIGLADITDSMMVIKKLVFEDKKVTLKELKNGVDNNFIDHLNIRALALKKVPVFGSGKEEAVEMANKIAKLSHDYYGQHKNFRGGKYTAGFWSMSNHVAFGSVTGAIPSGRLKGKAFTPGLTPSPHASLNLLDNIRDVAKLDPKNMNNNIAFNIKVVPSATDTHEKIVNSMFSYVKTYFLLGGMQMQMNVVTSEILKDAMKHPENYRNLIVRISGYNAYFVTLNHDMQMELIERAEYRI